MGVDGGVAVPREVLRAGADSGRLQARRRRRRCAGPPARGRRRSSGRRSPGCAGWSSRRRPAPGRGRPRLRPAGGRSRRRPRVVSAEVVDGAERGVARERRPSARVQAGDVAALLVGGDEHVGRGGVHRVGQGAHTACAGCSSRTGTPSPARPRAAARPRSEASGPAKRRPSRPRRARCVQRVRTGPRGPRWAAVYRSARRVAGTTKAPVANDGGLRGESGVRRGGPTQPAGRAGPG